MFTNNYKASYILPSGNFTIDIIYLPIYCYTYAKKKHSFFMLQSIIGKCKKFELFCIHDNV